MEWLERQRRSLGLMQDILKLKIIWWNWKKRHLDLDNPRTLNEKMQWLKIYWRDERMTLCADKYRVREYVKAKAGAGILNDLYGVYDTAADIDFDALPDSFVLKVNHTCGGNVLCPDKSRLDRNAARLFLDRHLRRNHYRKAREWCYKDIPRCIIAERYLEQDGKPPTDYKFFCFNGEPLFMGVFIDRFGNHQRDYLDIGWNPMPFAAAHIPPCEQPPPRPARLDDMAQLARVLSADFPFVRVDFYSIGDRIWFGEMTFYPSGGRIPFSPESYDRYWGDRLQLPDRDALGTYGKPG